MTAQSAHPDLAQGRWFTLTLPEQLGNVGSEYGRALSWKEKGQPQLMQKAFDRMLELLDLTIQDPRWKHRLKEIVRLREEVCRLQEPGDPSAPPLPDLKKYFLQFATLSRKSR